MVSDVEDYQNFVPWCQRSVLVTRHGEGRFDAELEVGFKVFVERCVPRRREGGEAGFARGVGPPEAAALQAGCPTPVAVGRGSRRRHPFQTVGLRASGLPKTPKAQKDPNPSAIP